MGDIVHADVVAQADSECSKLCAQRDHLQLVTDYICFRRYITLDRDPRFAFSSQSRVLWWNQNCAGYVPSLSRFLCGYLFSLNLFHVSLQMQLKQLRREWNTACFLHDDERMKAQTALRHTIYVRRRYGHLWNVLYASDVWSHKMLAISISSIPACAVCLLLSVTPHYSRRLASCSVFSARPLNQ